MKQKTELKGQTVIHRIQNTGQIKQKEKKTRPTASNQTYTAHIALQQQNKLFHAHLEHQDSLPFF